MGAKISYKYEITFCGVKFSFDLVILSLFVYASVLFNVHVLFSSIVLCLFYFSQIRQFYELETQKINTTLTFLSDLLTSSRIKYVDKNQHRIATSPN